MPRRTASDKVLHDEALTLVKNWKCNGYQYFISVLIKKTSDSSTLGGAVKIELCKEQRIKTKIIQTNY